MAMADDRRRGNASRQGRPPAKRSGGSTSGTGRGAGRGAGAGGSTRGGSSGSGGAKRTESGGAKRAGSGGTKRAGSGSTGQAGGSAGGRGAPRKGSTAGRAGGRAQGSPSGGGRSQGSGRGAAPRRDREEAPKRGGGFGPYAVDQRDEETREKRGGHSGERRPAARSTARSTGGAATQERSALRTVGKRTVGKRTVKDTKARSSRRAHQEAPSRRRRKRGPADVQQELGKLAGRNASRALGTLMAAADAFANDREREALRILRPLREQLPDSPSVRELAGLCQYRIGNYAAAAKELEAYADLSDSVDQHPVLMDCYRAQRRWRKVEGLWKELAAVSPTSELVTEGRIVYAGSLADQGRLPEALSLLRKRAERITKPGEHQLRLLYALADLEEKAGNLARARELFHQVRRADAAFADVAERLAALG
jgi:hypothetical protein